MQLIDTIINQLYFKNPGENFVFSPASYLEAMHSLALCVKGENLNELKVALNLSDDVIGSIESFKKKLNPPKSPYIRDDFDYKNIETYNNLFYASEYEAALDYTVVNLLKQFDTDIQALNFDDLDGVVTRVNALVEEKTKGKIVNFLSKGDLDELVKFVALNCVYFKKQWLHSFDEKKVAEPFRGQDKLVKYLNKAHKFDYYEDQTVDIVQLPYQNSGVHCYVFVPTENYSVLDLFHNFSEHFDKIKRVKNADNCTIDLTIPPFEVRSRFEDLAFLTMLGGVHKVFEWNKDWALVDFDKLLPEAVMMVSKIIQETYFNFTKTGTEATAATAIFLGISGCYMNPAPLPPPRTKLVKANKPFVYALADYKNKDLPLFVGVVNKV